MKTVPATEAKSWLVQSSKMYGVRPIVSVALDCEIVVVLSMTDYERLGAAGAQVNIADGNAAAGFQHQQLGAAIQGRLLRSR